ncbi:YeeE/YedE family protein [bacterium Unc6]|nr:YeeE/YedE family protein [bacterium Unc6]MBT9143969.1 hypothetical protein [Bacillota bacterium]MBT9148491.1 hypothetical protein [Bacillota bacterium]
MKLKEENGWSPYLAGALSGLVVIMSVWATGRFFGATTTFVRSAGMLEKLFAPERVDRLAYFVKYVPKIDWQWMFVIGILIGSLLAAVTSGSFRWQALPDMWKKRFGSSLIKRAVVAFIGGVIAIFGARLAGGCPSGQGLSGSLQLSISGLIAVVGFFAGGVVTARLLYDRGGERK